MIRTLYLSAAALVFAASTASAASERYTIDPMHSYANFKVDHLGFSKMYGRFNEMAGELTFDKDAVQNSALKVAVKAASINTGFSKRDDHLRSPDFFNAKEFPDLTFQSAKVEKTGEKTGKMTGNLTLLGVTKPVTLDVTFNKEGDNPVSKKYTVGFSAHGVVKRSDFGMKYGVPNIGDDIELLIEVEAQRQ